jgi:hypothetical protein
MTTSSRGGRAARRDASGEPGEPPARALSRSSRRSTSAVVAGLLALSGALVLGATASEPHTSAAGTAEQIRVSWTGNASTSLTIRWRADDAGAGSRARYKAATAASWAHVTGATVAGTPGTHHEVTLTGLAPGTAYDYQVAAGAGSNWSATHTVSTAPTGGSFRAAFVADTGIAGRRDGLTTGTRAVLDRIAAADPLVVLGGGDYAYFDSEDRASSLDHAIDMWTRQMTPLISESAFMPTFGNHEVRLGENVATWASRFATPDGLYHGGPHYSFDVAGVHFVSITAPVNWLEREVIDWLEQDLADVPSGTRATVVYLHHHAYGDGTVHAVSSSALADQLNPIFEEHGVQVVLTAHDQAYERTFPLRSGSPSTTERTCYAHGTGVTWVKTSPGGKLSNLSWGFSPFDASPSPAIASRDNSLHHYTLLDFGGGSDVQVTTYGVTGDGAAPVVVDRFRYAGSCGSRVSVTSMPVSVTLDRGGHATTAAITATASASGTIGLTENSSWLVTPTSIPKGASGTMTIDPAGLAPGTYVAQVTASAPGHTSDVTSVVLKVRGDTSGARLEVSASPDGSGRAPLHGAVLRGAAYVRLVPEAGSAVGQVRFLLNDAPKGRQTTPPYDYGGDGELDTTSLPDGHHRLDAVIVAPDGTVELAAATFRVDNELSSDDFEIMVSARADRQAAHPLDGATVRGDAYVFVVALPPVRPITSVQFHVDDPGATRAPVRTDGSAPFDLVGGDATTATAFDTETLSDGRHSVTARVTTGGTVVTTGADFTVGNTGPPPSDVVPLTPARLADSREGNPTVDGRDEAFGRLAAGAVAEIQVTGRGGVPAGAAAVLLNVTAVRPDGEGYFTVHPCDEPRPLASNVNYFAGGIEPNAVLAKLSATGSVCIYTFAASHLVVDVNGYTS